MLRSSLRMVLDGCDDGWMGLVVLGRWGWLREEELDEDVEDSMNDGLPLLTSFLPHFAGLRVFFLPTIRLSALQPQPTHGTHGNGPAVRIAHHATRTHTLNADLSRPSSWNPMYALHIGSQAYVLPSFLTSSLRLAPAAEPSQIGGTVYPSAQARSPLLPSHARHPHAICVHGPCSPASSNHHLTSSSSSSQRSKLTQSSLKAQAIDFSSCSYSRRGRKKEKKKNVLYQNTRPLISFWSLVNFHSWFSRLGFIYLL